MSDADIPIMRVLEAYRSAAWEKDVDAFMRLYAVDARVFDIWGVWSYEGAAAWRTAIEQWFATLGTERVQVQAHAIQVTAGQTMATLSAIVTYTGVSAEGQALHALHNRLSWVLRREGRAWKIVHEHTSAPIGVHDSKAILRRETAA